MAWNEPGGSNNEDSNNENKHKGKDENNSNQGGDKKPNNPWGSGGNQPPDLEQVVAEFFNKIKNVFGMNDGNGSSSSSQSSLPVILILLAIVGYALYHSAHKIGPSERGVVLVFGKYSKTMQPGLNFTWPKPISIVDIVDISKIYSVDEEGEMLTEDKNLVFLKFDIQYRIRENNVRDYLYELEKPNATVKYAAESAVRQIVGTNTMSHLLNENREIAITKINESLQAMLDQYSSGIQITNFNFKEVHPPAQVKNAFDDVVKAREDAKTYINKAKEYARKKIPLAEGDALKIIQEAEAYKQATIAKSEGEAQQFNLVREQYELAPEVTKERLYLETMEQVFGNTSKVIIDSESSNNMMYLPLDQMLKNTRNTQSELINLGTTTITAPGERVIYQRGDSTTRTGRTGR